tara:strand:+ start:301 stop:1452 length:1152 start_codon:yes stop_codon:yes gene_type:complete
MQKKLHFNSFIAASIAIFIPIFIWGNTVSHFPWIIEKLNFTNSTIGFLLMYFSIIQLIASQTAGRIIIPKIGTRNTLIIGIIIFSISPITFGLSNSKTLFLLSCFPTGIGFGMVQTTTTIITRNAEEKTGLILQTYLSAFLTLGFLCGALCSGIYRHFSFDSHYLFFTLIFVALGSTLFIFYFGLKPNLEENNEIEKIKIPEKNILIYGLYMFIFMGTVMALVDWAPLWFERELLTTSLIASLTIVSWSGGETIGKFLGAKLIILTNEKIIGAYIPLFGSLIYVLIIFYGNIYLILVGLFLLGFATANFFPIVIRIALRKTTDNINTAAANLSTIGFLGLLIGPAIVGYTSEIFSITTNTQAISIIWIILFLMFLYTIRNSRL